MSLLDIHLLGSPILRRETEIVSDVGDDVRQLVDDMFETMYAAKGIGLAAPQVGRSERVCIVDVDGHPLVLVNPEITSREGSERGEEGCLSIPEVYGEVERATRITVHALDRDGQAFEQEAAGLEARAIQHEIDHLHGRLFIDHLSLLKRRAALSRWEKLRKGDASLTRSLAPADVSRHHHRDEEM